MVPGAVEAALMILLVSFAARFVAGLPLLFAAKAEGDNDGTVLPLIMAAVAGVAWLFGRWGFAPDAELAALAGSAAACFVLFSAGIEALSDPDERLSPAGYALRLGALTLGAAAFAWLSGGSVETMAIRAAGAFLVLVAARVPGSAAPAVFPLALIGAVAVVAAWLNPQDALFSGLPWYARVPIAAGLAACVGLLRVLLRTLKQETSLSFAAALAAFSAGIAAASVLGFFPGLGALAAGMALGPVVSTRGRLSDRIRSISEGLGVPFVAAALGFAAGGAPRGRFGPEVLPVAAAAFALALARSIPWGSKRRKSRRNPGGWTAAGFAAALIADLAGLLPPGAVAGFAAGSLAGGIVGRIRGAVAKRTAEPEAERGEAAPTADTQRRRILVALANPDTLSPLVDAAGRLRTRPTDVVSPLCVVSGSDPSDAGLDRAETALARAMALSFTLGIEMMPSIRSASVTADGLVAAVNEPGVACSLFGWNKPPRLTGAFGGVTDRVIGESTGFVVLMKYAERFSAYGNLFMVVPPFLVTHVGFDAAMKALLTFSDSIRARVVAATTAGSAEAVKAAFRRFGKTVRVVEVPGWKELPKKAREQGGPRPAFIALSSRPAGTLWHPALEQIPAELSEAFPQSPILAAYLPETGETAETAAVESARHPFDDLVAAAKTADRIAVDMTESSVVDAVETLFDKALPDDRKQAARLASRFSTLARERPIELEPGVVLLHARVEGFEDPLFLFGARPAGWRLLAIDDPVRVLVVLCTPATADPAVHLEALSAIAREFGERGFAARLLAAKSAADL